MKKIVTFALCAAMASPSPACDAGADGKTNGNAQTTAVVQIPDPWTDCESLEKTAELTGFDMAAPDAIDGFSSRIIRAMDKDIIEVIYQTENTDEGEIRIRKGVGGEDISGDYNRYAESSTVHVGDLRVTMKGADGQISLAIWTSGGYTYSVGLGGSADGISSDEMSALVAAVR